MSSLLLDANLSWRLSKTLAAYFPGVIHVSEISKEVLTDTFIWQYAKDNNCVIVTFDEDFVELQLIRGFPPKIVWLRTGNQSRMKISQLLISKSVLIHDFVSDKDSGVLELY